MADEKKPEQKETPATGAETEPTETPTNEPAPPTPDLGDAGKRAIQSERDARKAAERRAADAEAKVQEFEDANKSETERLAGQAGREKKRADEADARAVSAEAKALRLQVALDKQVPAELIDRLRGETKEELEADAEALMALVGSGDGGKGGATPPGSFDGGARKPAPQKSLDDQIAEAERAGNWDVVDRLNLAKLAQVRAS